MAIRPYPSQWEVQAELPQTGEILIRPIRPEDEALYEEFFAHVTSDDQRLRFFTAVPDLSHRFLARLTQIDYAREMAFIAVTKDTGALLGVVRLVLDPDAVDLLNRTAARAKVVAAFDDQASWRIQPASSGVDGARLAEEPIDCHERGGSTPVQCPCSASPPAPRARCRCRAR